MQVKASYQADTMDPTEAVQALRSTLSQHKLHDAVISEPRRIRKIGPRHVWEVWIDVGNRPASFELPRHVNEICRVQ